MDLEEVGRIREEEEESCLIRNMVAVEPEGVPSGFSLPSGKVKFLTFTGATDAEIEFAKQNRSAKLIEALRAAGRHKPPSAVSLLSAAAAGDRLRPPWRGNPTPI
jgi:hypothetical protein